jgi:hypothetical protein
LKASGYLFGKTFGDHDRRDVRKPGGNVRHDRCIDHAELGVVPGERGRGDTSRALVLGDG